MTEKEALIWIVGIFGSACAAAITLDKVLDIIPLSETLLSLADLTKTAFVWLRPSYTAVG